jgi:integrase
VILIRSIFNYAKDHNLIDREVRFGSEFTKPGKAVMRKHKEASDKKLFAADEIRTIIHALDGIEVLVKKKTRKVVKVKLAPNRQLRAAVMLACNAGLGNTDISSLQFKHLDLRTQWLNFPRIKSGLAPRAPLWNETVAALNAAIAQRRPHKSPVDAKCVFTNRAGRRLVQMTERSNQDYVSSQSRAALRELNINGQNRLRIAKRRL